QTCALPIYRPVLTERSCTMTSSTEQPAALWALDDIVRDLRAVRRQWRDAQGRTQAAGLRELPSREALRAIITQLCGALFPMRLGPHDLRDAYEDFYVGHTLGTALSALRAQASLELRYLARLEGRQVEADIANEQATALVREFASQLPALRAMLDNDVLAAYQGDPAARSVDE